MKLLEEFKKMNGQIPALIVCLKSRETPFLTKLFAALAVAYALSPIDIVPDFIPVLGYFDDAIILPLLVCFSVHSIPKDVWQRNLEASKSYQNIARKRWVFAIPIVVFWLIIILVILKACKVF